MCAIYGIEVVYVFKINMICDIKFVYWKVIVWSLCGLDCIVNWMRKWQKKTSESWMLSVNTWYLIEYTPLFTLSVYGIYSSNEVDCPNKHLVMCCLKTIFTPNFNSLEWFYVLKWICSYIHLDWIGFLSLVIEIYLTLVFFCEIVPEKYISFNVIYFWLFLGFFFCCESGFRIKPILWLL